MQRIGVRVVMPSVGSTLTLVRKKKDGTREKKRIFVIQAKRKSYTVPKGWELVNETHWMSPRGSIDDYPKLKKLLGNKKVIELPKQRHLWYDG
jgi:hypothetical protein